MSKNHCARTSFWWVRNDAPHLWFVYLTNWHFSLHLQPLQRPGMCKVDNVQRFRFGSPPTSSQDRVKQESTFTSTFSLRTIYEVNGTAWYLERSWPSTDNDTILTLYLIHTLSLNLSAFYRASTSPFPLCPAENSIAALTSYHLPLPSYSFSSSSSDHWTHALICVFDRSINRSINPSIHWSFNRSIHQSIYPLIHQSMHWLINSSIYQSIEPSIHQYIYWSINPSIESSINPSIDQSIDQYIDWSIDPSVNQSIDRSINPSIHQFIDHLINPYINASIDPSTNQSFNQYIHWLIYPSIDQSIDTPINALIDPSIHSSTHWPIHPSTHPIDPSIHRSINPLVPHFVI